MAARQVVLDTETTGLNARQGDRIVEIGCIELLNRRVSERHYHVYLNPEREIDEGAQKVHGLSREFLSDKPRFADICREFADYVHGAEVIIHNAAFDVEFLDAEFARCGLGRFAAHALGVVDTLAMARELHPGRRNSLDALCERYEVDNAHRSLHGALLDARLLAEVYLRMTRGQESLLIDLDTPGSGSGEVEQIDSSKLVVLRASTEEVVAHEKMLDGIDRQVKGGSIWRRTPD